MEPVFEHINWRTGLTILFSGIITNTRTTQSSPPSTSAIIFRRPSGDDYEIEYTSPQRRKINDKQRAVPKRTAGKRECTRSAITRTPGVYPDYAASGNLEDVICSKSPDEKHRPQPLRKGDVESYITIIMTATKHRRHYSTSTINYRKLFMPCPHLLQPTTLIWITFQAKHQHQHPPPTTIAIIETVARSFWKHPNININTQQQNQSSSSIAPVSLVQNTRHQHQHPTAASIITIASDSRQSKNEQLSTARRTPNIAHRRIPQHAMQWKRKDKNRSNWLHGASTGHLREPCANSHHRAGLFIHTHVRCSHTSLAFFARDCSITPISDAIMYHFQSLTGSVRSRSCQMFTDVDGVQVKDKWRGHKGKIRWTAKLNNAYWHKIRNKFEKSIFKCQVIHYSKMANPVRTYSGIWSERLIGTGKLHRQTSKRWTLHKATKVINLQFFPATHMNVYQISHHNLFCQRFNNVFRFYI